MKYRVLCRERGVYKCVHVADTRDEALKVKEVMRRFYGVVIVEEVKE